MVGANILKDVGGCNFIGRISKMAKDSGTYNNHSLINLILYTLKTTVLMTFLKIIVY